ncbi:PopZ family protein [Aurantimonas sp. VKM B-3413]|uniref:PopZ family protein n=1 Tax=Aurantimonas sp. VKM B-3413 TaxID=2779401 RepID=UPI001E3D1DCA|nr:DUF2497 domain-containing protein [Aurantimonas sp. VKM B-3413]MCB8837129.1 DUF2497 domain-containing protein [Aurantimonas sp. VKM B-3413]
MTGDRLGSGAVQEEAKAETLPTAYEDRGLSDDLSVARSRAASLADASERRRGDLVTELRPANAMTAPRPVEDSPQVGAPRPGKAEMPQWPEAVVANDRAAPDAAEADAFLGEFDEQDFARELLDKVGLIEPASPSAASAPEHGAGSVGESRPDAGAAAATLDGDPADGPMRVAHALISQEAGERVAASFSSLASAIQQEHLRDVDGVVREMLRPMLQEWLDDNLPKLVERLVREEIERVARGGR